MDKLERLTVDYLKVILSYKDGKLFWNERVANNSVDVRFNTTYKGKEAGNKNQKGYLRLRINRIEYQVHRIVFYMFHGYAPKIIDHLDGNPLNNKLENLAESSKILNSRNKKKPSNNTSGYKNIRFNHGKYHVAVRLKEKQIYLGSFSLLQNAIEARNKFKIGHNYTARDLNG